jgi:hypothetical protein
MRWEDREITDNTKVVKSYSSVIVVDLPLMMMEDLQCPSELRL